MPEDPPVAGGQVVQAGVGQRVAGLAGPRRSAARKPRDFSRTSACRTDGSADAAPRPGSGSGRPPRSSRRARAGRSRRTRRSATGGARPVRRQHGGAGRAGHGDSAVPVLGFDGASRRSARGSCRRASHTSVKPVGSGDRPMPDGVRRAEVGQHAGLDEPARRPRRASGRLMLTCAPRRAASRGEPSEKPCGTSHSSVSETTISVSATAFAPDRGDAGLGDDRGALAHGEDAEQRRRAGQHRRGCPAPARSPAPSRTSRAGRASPRSAGRAGRGAGR